MYKFNRTFIAATSSWTGGTDFVTLLDLGPNTWPSAFKTFLSNFDYLRVPRVRVDLVPRFNTADALDGLNLGLPQVAIASEYDSTVSFSTFDQVAGRLGSTITRFSGKRSITVCPSILSTMVLAPALTANGLMTFGSWFNLQAGTPLLLGVRYAINSGSLVAGTQGSWDVNYSIDVEACQAQTG